MGYIDQTWDHPFCKHGWSLVAAGRWMVSKRNQAISQSSRKSPHFKVGLYMFIISSQFKKIENRIDHDRSYMLSMFLLPTRVRQHQNAPKQNPSPGSSVIREGPPVAIGQASGAIHGDGKFVEHAQCDDAQQKGRHQWPHREGRLLDSIDAIFLEKNWWLLQKSQIDEATVGSVEVPRMFWVVIPEIYTIIGVHQFIHTWIIIWWKITFTVI